MALRFLSLLMHEVLARGEVVSGFADTVEYQFANSQDTFYFLGLTQSFASYVRDNEQEFTYTFRTFLKDDNLSVLILERFVNKTAHDQLHLPSAAHTAFSKEVGDWNATSGAIIGKVRGYWYETEYGTFSADDLVSGFADTVVYRFDSKEDAQTYMGFLQPLAEDVKANEQDITLKEKLISKNKQVKELLEKDAKQNGDLNKLQAQVAKLDATRANLNMALGESKASKGLLAAKLQTALVKQAAAVADENAARQEAEEEASRLSATKTLLERAEDGPHVDKVEAMKVELSSAKELVKDFNATAVEQSAMLKEAAEEEKMLTQNLETRAKDEEAEKNALSAKDAEEKALKAKLESAPLATVEKKLEVSEVERKEEEEKVAKLSSALVKENKENDELRHELPSATIKKHSLRASA